MDALCRTTHACMQNGYPRSMSQHSHLGLADCFLRLPPLPSLSVRSPTHVFCGRPCRRVGKYFQVESQPSRLWLFDPRCRSGVPGLTKTPISLLSKQLRCQSGFTFSGSCQSSMRCTVRFFRFPPSTFVGKWSLFGWAEYALRLTVQRSIPAAKIQSNNETIEKGK